MPWNVGDRSHQLARKRVPVGDQRLEQSSIRRAVRAKLLRGVFERAPCENRSSVVERVSDGCGRLDQVEIELQRAEERRSQKRRVDRRADVVTKSRQRQLLGARAAPDRLVRFDDADRAPGLGERDRGRKAVRPCSDDNSV